MWNLKKPNSKKQSRLAGPRSRRGGGNGDMLVKGDKLSVIRLTSSGDPVYAW